MAEETNKKKYLDYVGTRKLVENIKEYVDSHTENEIIHITANERTDWNSAKTHADSNHAPSDAEKNQNAFSNIKVGDKTIIADTETDTLTLVAGDNVTILPDENGDSITISAKNTEITVDAELKDNSTNPVQNKIIKSALDNKVNKTDLDEKADLEHNHDVATDSSNGFMSSADKKKLDEISEGADSVLFEQKLTTGVEVGTITINETSTTLYAPANTNTTYDLSATQNSNENVKLNLIANGSGSEIDSIEIIGDGATNVYRDTNSGAIVIESSDNNTTYDPAGTSLGLVKSGGDVTISSGIITVNGKADENHTHDDRYYTETEMDTKLKDKADKTHNHDNSYYGKSDGETLADTLDEVKKDVDDFFKDALGDTDAQQVKNTLREIQDYIDSDVEAASAMTASINGKAEKEHTHEIADVTNLQTALDDKASQTDLNTHVNKKDNPHEVTLNQLGVTATAQELNILDGAKIVVDELNFVQGTTSNIQTQLNNKAPLVHNHEIDWENKTTTDDGYIANKPMIQQGEKENAIVMGQGDAKGQYSIAGGTNDTSLVKNMMGSWASLTSIDKPTAHGDMSLAFGAGTKAYSAGTMAFGAKATAGCLGFYWHSIDWSGTSPVIQLTTVQKPYYKGLLGIEINKTATWTTDAANKLANWKVGDAITIVNNIKYGEKSVITAVDSTNGKITVDSLPFTSGDVSFSSTTCAAFVFDDISVYCPVHPDSGVINFGMGALSLGLETNAAGSFATALGYKSKVTTDFGHAEGRETVADYAAHAEGYQTKANNIGSHSEGYLSESHERYSHTEGHYTYASGIGAHAEGYNDIKDADGNEIDITTYGAHGNGSHTEGVNTLSTGKGAHAEGRATTAIRDYAHAEGYDTSAEGIGAHSEGRYSTAKGIGSHAEGGNTNAEGDYAHTEGNVTHTTANYAHAEGNNSHANGVSSHAEGEYSKAKGKGAHSEGSNTIAEGNYSHTEGYSTTARGNNAHAEGGCNTVAPEFESTVTNDEIITQHKSTPFTLAKGNNSHSEGHSTMSLGIGGHSEGRQSVSVGDISHAEGDKTYAYGVGSHSEGISTESKGNASHAEGNFTISEGKCAHAEGRETSAIGEDSHAEGYNTTAFGNNSHAEGNSSREYNPAGKTIDEIITDHDQLRGDENSYLTYELKHSFSLAYGVSSHTEGKDTLAVGKYSHAEGENTEASGYASHAEGGGFVSIDPTIEYFTKASGSYSHAEGFGTKASGHAAHAEGYDTSAKGSSSHSEGKDTLAVGKHSHAEGIYTTAIGEGSHVEGLSTCSYGNYSHTEGSGMSYVVYIEMGEANVTTYSVDNQIKLEDRLCIGAIITSISCIDPNTNNRLEADNINAKVISIDKDNLTFTVDKTLLNASFTNAYILVYANQLAVSLHSHVEGTGNIAYGRSQHVQGEFNDIDPEYKNNDQEARCKYAHIIGNGTSISNRSNAHTVDWDGNAWYAGDIKAEKSLIGTSASITGEAIVGSLNADSITTDSFTLNNQLIIGNVILTASSDKLVISFA